MPFKVNEFSHKDKYKLMRKFYNLSASEVRIMDYLMERAYAEITYSKLTEELGLDKQKMTSNVRKAILHLQELGIVYVVNKYYADDECQINPNPMKACFIVDGWMDNLLKAEI